MLLCNRIMIKLEIGSDVHDIKCTVETQFTAQTLNLIPLLVEKQNKNIEAWSCLHENINVSNSVIL